MEKFIVKNTKKLSGRVKVSGAKNAVLPILAGCLLTKEECIIHNVPLLKDVSCMLDILRKLGAKVDYNEEKQIVKIKAENISTNVDLEKECSEMRASFLIAGALISRFKNARVALPGGCQIGSRPVDLHLKGFNLLGVKHKLEYGIVDFSVEELVGNTIYLDFPSVGATENLMMCGIFAKGETIIENSATEPEIVDLANFLKGIGANIKGEGSDTIIIRGITEKDLIKDYNHYVIADRIEAGTFMVGVAMVGGEIILENIKEDHLKPVIAKLLECNVNTEVIENGNALKVYQKGELQPIQVKTMPYPGFPTDMQAQFMSLMTIIKGTSIITETVFENRFLHANELQRLGADIKIDSRNAIIEGVGELTGGKVKATDLRGGVALILSALKAKGETEIGEIHHIERGYYQIENKLKKLGANIEKVKDIE